MSQPAICKSNRQKICQMAWGSARVGNVFTQYVLQGYWRHRHEGKVTRWEDLQGCYEFHLFTANSVPPDYPQDCKNLNYPSFSKWHFAPCTAQEDASGAMWYLQRGMSYCKPTCCPDPYSELQLNTAKLSGSKIKTEPQDGKESQSRCNYTHFYISLLNFNAFYGPLNKWIIQDS